MPGTPKRLAGPAFLGATAGDVYAPPASTMYVLLRHIHLCNVTGAQATFRLFIGATGGSASGTELFRDQAVPANGVYDWYAGGQGLPMKSTDFLSGLASAGSTLTITVSGDQIVVP